MLSLTHGAFASKSLFSHYKGAGVLFPDRGKPGEKNIIVSGRAKDTWFIGYMNLLNMKEKSNP